MEGAHPMTMSTYKSLGGPPAASSSAMRQLTRCLDAIALPASPRISTSNRRAGDHDARLEGARPRLWRLMAETVAVVVAALPSGAAVFRTSGGATASHCSR
jgi:hypothetical protein